MKFDKEELEILVALVRADQGTRNPLWDKLVTLLDAETQKEVNGL